MKTSRRTEILNIIEKKGKVRPFELYHTLPVSRQLIHRYLSDLTKEGLVEARGSPPFTQYVMAGVPDLEAVSKWLNARTAPKGPDSLVCESSAIFAGRLPRLKAFVKNGLPQEILPLVISTAGEIGNNSFDHNLGQWRDIPGCWFEAQVTGRELWICIADRGQGIFQSLVKVHPELKDEQAALHAAFETIISGRAPDKRGNGLKYVKKNLTATPGGGIACMSGAAHVRYGDQGEKCLALLNKNFIQVQGTVTLMVWKLS